ncbi:MAG TPA: RNA methyltransferase [Anaerolineae bacterium]
MPGAEEIAWLEIRSRLPKAEFGETLFAKEQNGIVLFDYEGSIADLLQLRTVEDVFILALSIDKLSRGWRDLRQVADRIADGAIFGRAVGLLSRYQSKRSKSTTYRVIARKYGRHQYRRKDLQDAVLKGVKRRYPQWRPVQDDAQVEIWANLLGSRLLCGLRLSDRSMRHRHKKVVELEASLRPSVAAAMVFLSEPAPEDVFLDPMCGSGTLLMERRLAGPYRQMLAADIEAERAQATLANLLAQRKEPPRALTVMQADARHLPFAGRAIDKVATNLPFGKQVGSPQVVADLYPAFFRQLEWILRPGGRAVVLSSEYEQVKEAVRQQDRLVILTGYSVAVLGQWGRIYIVERRA